MDRRVVITGLGAVSPLGSDLPALWQRWSRGESAVRDHDFPGREVFPHGCCARTPDDLWEDRILNRRLLKFMNREARMMAAAASMALGDAGLRGDYGPDRIGLYVGTGLTSCEMEELLPVVEGSFDGNGRFSCRRLGEFGLAACNPLLSFKILPNMTLCTASMLHDVRGDNLIFTPWPGNTAQAIIAGVRAIQWGSVDCALVGGGDCKTHFIGFLTLSQLGLLAPSGSCRPFEGDGDGLVPGEGAAVLVLEDLESARRRSAPIFAEIAGSAEGTDSATATLYPRDPATLRSIIAGALADAGAGPEDVDAIFCSAGSHPAGDLSEARALAAVFLAPPPLSSLKPVFGDMLAAAPAMALAVAAYALKDRLSPPRLEPRRPDPALPDGLFQGGSGRRPPETILVDAFDLGPAKASLVVRRAR
jgi:3-oxoacyl-[acyl-carrier-protein] synthase II